MMDILELAHGAYSEAASMALLHFVWQGLLLGAGAAAALRAMSGSAPRTRYAVACGFLLTMAAAPLVTFLLLMADPVGAAALTATSHPPGAIALVPPFAQPITDWSLAVLAIWSIGVGIFSLRAMGGWALAFRRFHAERQPVSAAVAARVEAIARRLGMRQRVRAFESSMARVPAIFGALRPVLVLPGCVLTGIPPAQLEAILAHELAHVLRRDFAVNCLQSVVEALLFYHPCVWWLSRRIRQEREMCCDDMAAETCGDKVLYSRALLALEVSRQAFAQTATGGDLKARIERLLAPGRQARNTGPAALIPLTLASMAMVAAILVTVPPAPALQAAQSQDWADQDAGYLMSDPERRAWKRLTKDKEREQFIRQFWLRRDPDPATPGNPVKEEHERRVRYANSRFKDSRAGWATARGRIYIVNGPPDEIESHPKELREEWRYKDGRQFVFRGEKYELMTEKPRARRAPDSGLILAGIEMNTLPDSLRRRLRPRLAAFAGQPMSNTLREELRVMAKAIGHELAFTWRVHPLSRNTVVEISYC